MNEDLSFAFDLVSIRFKNDVREEEEKRREEKRREEKRREEKKKKKRRVRQCFSKTPDCPEDR